MLKKNISIVLVSSITVAVLLAVATIVVYVSRSSYEQTLALQQQSMRHVGVATHTALRRYMAGHVALVRTLATQQAILEAFDGRPERARERLREYINANPDYRSIFLFDAQGSIIAGYSADGQDLSGQSRSDRDYVQAITNGKDTYFGQEILSAKSGNGADLTFPVVLAVKGENGAAKGGIGVFPKWEVFTQAFIDPPRFGTRGYAYMLDAQGKVIAHATDKNLLLQDYSSSDFIRQTLSLKNGDIFYDWKGEHKYQSFFTDPQTGWTLCLNAYVDDLTATATTQRNILLGIGAGAVLLLALIVTSLVRRLVVRPIHSIEAFTSAIAQGDFHAALNGTFHFELAHLAENIRAMSQELKNKLGFSQGVLAAFTLPCCAFDQNNKATFINQAMLDAIGRQGKPETYLGQTSGQFFYNDSERETVSAQALKTGMKTHTEGSYTVPDGREKIFDVTSTPLMDLDHNLLGTLAVWFDLTDIRAQQRMIEAQKDKIAAAARQATDISSRLSTAAEELAAQIEEASRGTESQKLRLTETATASEQMNSSILEVAKNSGEAAKNADQTKSHAETGQIVVSETVQAIETVRTRSEEMASTLKQLGEQAAGIGNIIGIISDIADQTNLLALNAAIEAARAGDAGRGFAVVADEVRKLAEKTMTATKEVEQAITAIQHGTRQNITLMGNAAQSVQQTVDLTGKAGDALRRIVEVSADTADMIRNIATAAEEQSTASEQITRSTDEISLVATETADAMNQSAEAVAELARMAEDLRQLIHTMQE